MGGSLFGLGAGTPTRFPYPDRPQPSPGVGPSSAAVVRANQVIVFGPTGRPVGVFVYQPGTIPGPGNQPIGWVTASATDPFGNVLPVTGTGGKDASGYFAIHGSEAVFNVTGSPAALAGILAALNPGEVRLESPAQVVADPQAVMQLLSKAANGGTFPVVNLLSGTALGVTGPVTATGGTAANPTVITNEAGWNTLTLQNGWAASGGNVRYRLMPDNSVWVLGQLNPAALTSTTFATMVAPYVPSVGGDFAVAAHTATPPTQGLFTRAANTGVLSALNATVGSGIFGVNMRYPLD